MANYEEKLAKLEAKQKELKQKADAIKAQVNRANRKKRTHIMCILGAAVIEIDKKNPGLINSLIPTLSEDDSAKVQAWLAIEREKIPAQTVASKS